MEFKKRAQLETENRDLRAELSAMRCKHEQLKKSKSQLKEEVTCLKNCLETNMVDHSRMELCKRDIEEQAAQEIRQILQQVNLFLQAQAASQDRIEQIRASHHESLRNQLKERIRHFELELDNMKKTQQDFISLKESLEAEVEKYTQLYLQETKIRARFANELERTNEEIAEANAKLLQEYDRRISSLRQSIARGHHNEIQRRNASRPTGSVEAFVAQMRQEMDEKIRKETEQANADLEKSSAQVPAILSAYTAEQDPLQMAMHEYRNVLMKNYKI